MRVVEAGPLRATLEIQRRILHSAYTQRISLATTARGSTSPPTIDWRERHILLKVAFPVDVLAPAATYEIQWGNVERPTHRNTSWDWARFETCAQKWVDLSEGGYGVSLLNDCKYGHDIQGQRHPPDPAARRPTIPTRRPTWASTLCIQPAAARWGLEAGTQRQAYALNDPLIVSRGQGQPGQGLPSLVACDRGHVVIETVKQAEDGNGVIVRLYESQRRARCRSPSAALSPGQRGGRQPARRETG